MAEQSKLAQVADAVENRCMDFGLEVTPGEAALIARAAIEAMRPKEFGDLPEAMCLAAENAGAQSYGEAHEIFAAMLDATLKD